MGSRSVKCFNKSVQGDATSFTFDGSIAPIVTDTRTVFDAQVDAMVRLGQQFDSIIAAGRIIGAKVIQIDDASRAEMSKQLATNNAWPISWIAADNSILSLSQLVFSAGCKNVNDYYQAMVLNRRAHKNTIAALADVVSCDAYDVTTGWPP